MKKRGKKSALTLTLSGYTFSKNYFYKKQNFRNLNEKHAYIYFIETNSCQWKSVGSYGSEAVSNLGLMGEEGL